jgi:protein-S-isoprenylcysteine O-methyltransferase Ste14
MSVLTPGRIAYLLFNVLFFCGLILGLGGDLHWTEGWVFTAWFIVTTIGSVLYLNRHSPELLAERFARPGSGGQKGWYKIFIALLMTVVVIWFAIMPLDVRRFHWTPSFPFSLKVLGLILLLLADYVIMRAMLDNPFASPLIRIQSERKQMVVSTGSYSIVRHPMYFGGLLYFFGGPLLLGSVYGLFVAAVLTIMVVLRIYGEERVLLNELEGYADYRKKVKYRLIPYVW